MDSTPDKTHLMDAEEISALIDKIAQEICDKNKYANQDDFVFIGIHRGGVPLAERLVKSIEKKACFLPPLGTLDISMYRDDIGMRKTLPYIFETRIPFDINGKVIILVDDVLQSGRSIRAALDAITDYGRPNMIRLAVLVDRGDPEYPIRADYVGFKLDLDPAHKVAVQFDEDGDEAGIFEVNWQQKPLNR